MSDELSELKQQDKAQLENQEASPNLQPADTDTMKAQSKTQKKPSSVWAWILFLLIILALGAIGYLWQQLQFVSNDLVKNSSYQLDIKTRQQSLAELQRQLNTAEEKLAKSTAELSILQSNQAQIASKISNISGVNRIDWLSDELQHLSRLAHQRLLLSHDAIGAVALLKAADKVVIEMREASALPIREAISQDLIALEIAANHDLEGAYIRLNSLNKKIEDLNVKTLSFPKYEEFDVVNEEKAVQNELEDSTNNRFEKAFSHIVAKIQPYLYRSFSIDGEIAPMLSSDERQYLSRNIQLAFEQAQLALLRREPESYRLSIEQSEVWIKKYYDLSDPTTLTLLNMLHELKGYRLSPDMPEITQTLDAIKQFVETWKQKQSSQPIPKGV